QWLNDFFTPEKITSAEYFGNTKHVGADGEDGAMVGIVKEFATEEKREQLPELKAVLAALSAEAKLPYQQAEEAKEAELIAQGKTLWQEGMSIDNACTDCHTFHEEVGGAPKLKGWGSREWLTEFIKNPASDD